MKILTIIGARPQFIKAAALSRAFSNRGIEEIIVHTGQHFDANMSEVFFEEMGIPVPNYNLGINSLSHGAMTGRMLEKIEEILIVEKPDVLVVYGDTNSTIAGALAAKKLGVKVAHIEAGLRSFNMSMPEEINRILTDRISDYLFCPTETAVHNLQNEGFSTFYCKIKNVGDVMYDTAIYYSKLAAQKSRIVKTLALRQNNFILATVHRQENTDDLRRLHGIIDGLNKLSETNDIVVPLHPRTRKIIEEQKIDIRFKLIDPVGYFDMLELIKNSALVITDSGGLQKEAYFSEKYCVTMRDETEWTELVDNGFNVLAGANTEKIKTFAIRMLSKEKVFDVDLYGDGKAANLIVDELLKN